MVRLNLRIFISVITVTCVSWGDIPFQSKDYTKPLYFDPKDYGQVLPLELEYKLFSSNNLEVGGVVIQNSSISMDLQLDSKTKKYTLHFSRPKAVYPEGIISLRTIKDNQTFFTFNTGKDDVKNLESPALETWKVNTPFRYCMESVSEGLAKSFCSKPLILIKQKDEFWLESVKEYRKKLLKAEKLAKKKMTLAKDQTNLKVFYRPVGKPQQLDSVQLPLTADFMKKQVGEGVATQTTRYKMAPKNPKRNVSVDERRYAKNIAMLAFGRWKKNSTFKFCAEGKGCSEEYVFVEVTREFNIDDLSPEQQITNTNVDFPLEILVDGKLSKLEGVIPATENKLQIRARLSDGGEYSIETIKPPGTYEYKDVSQDEVKKTMAFKGKGYKPVEADAQSTEDEWSAKVPLKNPYLHFKSPNEFAFRQGFKPKRKLASEQQRAYLRYDSRTGTYVDAPVMRGMYPNSLGMKVNSNEIEAQMIGDQAFTWRILTSDKNQNNRRHINLITKSKEPFPAYYDIERALPFEANIRFLLSLTDIKSILVQGQLGMSGWLEQFGSWDHPHLSVQRWGASLNYYQSINNARNQTGEAFKLSVLTAEIKYKLKQGVWNREATYGPILAYQNVKAQGPQASMMGLGGFWGRTFPHFLSRSSWLWLRHPKWFDVEAIYYPLAVGSGFALKTNFHIFSHLKLFFKPTWFVEAGLGYDYLKFTNTNNEFQISSVIGTIGTGIIF